MVSFYLITMVKHCEMCKRLFETQYFYKHCRHRIKEFRLQESPLTVLFETNVIGRTIYNLFTANFLFMLITSLLKDYTTKREIGVFQGINMKFKKFDTALLIWLGLNAVAFLSYFCFRLWARVRSELKPNNFKVWDHSWILMLCALYVMPFYYFQQSSTISQMGAATVALLIEELLRLLMKIHAFVRSNAPRVLKCNRHEEKASDLPMFTTFLYFLYAPTMIYRDVYPRTDKYRWSFVVCRILELAALIIFITLCFIDGLIPLFQKFCTRIYRPSEIVSFCFQAGIHSAWIMWATHIILFHSIQNIVGELLCFGDRSFYGDWWTCSDYKEFFRKWNLLVSDWLYLYIFKDMYDYITPGKRNFSKMIAFFISIIVHEWVVLMVVGFIMPVCGAFFLSGMLMSFFLSGRKYKYFNTFLLFNEFLGLGTMSAFISLEHNARLNLNLNSAGNLPVMFTNCTIW